METLEAVPYALLANDFHVGVHNIAEFEKNWDEMIKTCREYGVEKLFIGGDVYESRAGQTLDVLRAVRKALDSLEHYGIETVVLDGNHDKTDGDSVYSYNSIFANCHPNISFTSTYAVYDIPGSDVTFYVLSYFNENGKFMDVFKAMVSRLDRNRYNILYCHQGISGGLSKPTAKEVPAGIFDIFDRVLVGHYHNRNQIFDTNIEYIGASRQHNFGEDDEKGYTILYTDGTTDFVKNEVNRTFVTYDVDFKDLKGFIERMAGRSDDLRAHESVRLRLTCPASEVKNIDRRALFDAGVALLKVDSQETKASASQADFKTKYDKAGIKDEYRGYCASEGVDAEEVGMGLEYLDKIDESVCGI